MSSKATSTPVHRFLLERVIRSVDKRRYTDLRPGLCSTRPTTLVVIRYTGILLSVFERERRRVNGGRPHIFTTDPGLVGAT